jgi:hypothetical protein
MDLNFSIGRIILLTYIIISSSYCADLFSAGLKKSIKNNRYVQHLLLIILIMSLLIIFGNPFGVELTSSHQLNILIMTLLVYVWFIMTTKLDVAWNMSIIILLLIYFLYESKQIGEYKIISKDPNLDNKKKIEIVESNNDLQKYVLVGLFGITLAGTFLYANEKQEQYGGGFSTVKFFFE